MSCPLSAPSDFPVPCNLVRNRAFSHNSIKKEIGTETGEPLTKEVVEQMYSETMKGQDALHPSVSPEQVVDLIIANVSGMELADADSLGEVRQALLHMVQRIAEQDHEAKNK